MDPNATLARIREISEVVDVVTDVSILADLGIELANLVTALDEWAMGGFLPRDWK